MNVEEFGKIDKTFNAGDFLTKANSLFLKILDAMMTDKLDDIRHFLHEDVYKCLKENLNRLKKENCLYVFKDINIRNSIIIDVEVNESVYIIKVFLQSIYRDYIINLSNGKLVPIDRFMDDLYKPKKEYLLTFAKKVGANNQELVKRCPGCGAPLNIHETGKCQYCGAIYNQEDVDWILIKLENN